MPAKKDNYIGVVIEESLEDKSFLNKIKIISVEVEDVNKEHKTPWLDRWTLDTVEIEEDKAKEIAEEISMSLEKEHPWYADFKNNEHHFIIFRNKVFFIDRQSKEQYDVAKQYGISLGIPEYQVDFHPDIVEWKK